MPCPVALSLLGPGDIFYLFFMPFLVKSEIEARNPHMAMPWVFLWLALAAARAHGLKADGETTISAAPTKIRHAKEAGGMAGSGAMLRGGKRHGGSAAAQIARVLRFSQNKGTLKTQDDLLRAAQHVATPSRALMFTTVSMDAHKYQLLFLRQWAGNLRARTANALVIGANQHTCTLVRNASIPCFVDALAPTLKGRQNEFGHQASVLATMPATPHPPHTPTRPRLRRLTRSKPSPNPLISLAGAANAVATYPTPPHPTQSRPFHPSPPLPGATQVVVRKSVTAI